MRKLKLAVLFAFGAGLAFTTAAQAGTVGYTFDVTTHYQFGGCNTNGTICASPDTGFLTVVNNGTSTFSGTISLSGTSPGCGSALDTFTGTFAAGASWTFALSTDSSNCGGWNNPNGALFNMTGAVTGVGSEAVNLSVNDGQIHSGVFQTSPCDGILTDAFVLNGGSPTGCDNNDPYETSQADGHYEFFEASVSTPEPSSAMLLGTVVGALGLALFARNMVKSS